MEKMIGDSRQDILTVLSDIDEINSQFDETLLQRTQSLLNDNTNEISFSSTSDVNEEITENLITSAESVLNNVTNEMPCGSTTNAFKKQILCFNID